MSMCICQYPRFLSDAHTDTHRQLNFTLLRVFAAMSRVVSLSGSIIMKYIPLPPQLAVTLPYLQ